MVNNSLPSSNPLLQEKSHLIPSTRVLPPALSWNERCSSPHVSPATGWDFLVHPRWVFLFCLFVLECNCFTMRCYFLLFNEVNQLCVYMYPLSLGPTSHLHPPSHSQVITDHQAELPALHGSFPPALYFIHGSVYMSILISQFIPPSPSLLCPQVRYLYLHLCSCPGSRFICTIFLDSTYTAAQTRKQAKYPMTDEWIKKMWYIYMMEYYLAIKKNETGSFVEIWVDLQSVIQSEVSQKKKNKYGPATLS